MAVDIAGQFMLEKLAEFRSSDRLTDIELVCRGKSWKTHRVILALHSDVFPCLCDGPAGQSGQLDLSPFDPEVVDCVVEYVYTRDYTTPSKSTIPLSKTTMKITGPGGPPHLRFASKPDPTPLAISELEVARHHIEVCKFANEYEMRQLKVLAHDKFEAAIECWDFDEEGPRIQDWKDLLELAYQDDQATRNICVSSVKAMIERDSLREICFTIQLKDLMAKYPAFAVDVATQLARRLGVRGKSCPKDGKCKAKAPYVYREKFLCVECKDVFWACIPDEDGDFACPECGQSQPNDDYALITDQDELEDLSMGRGA